MDKVLQLPLFLQIAIIALFVIFGIPLLIAFIRGKGEIKVKNITLSFSQQKNSDPNLEIISDYMLDKLDQMRQCIFAGYLKLLKQRGCPEEILTENEDSEFVAQMLGNIIWSGNGIRSVKSVLEKMLIEKAFMSYETMELSGSIIASIEQNTKTYINKNYRTNIYKPTGETRERIVSNTEWVDYLPKCMKEVQGKVEEIIAFSKHQYRRKDD